MIQTQSRILELAQNCLALAIFRCREAGVPLTSRRQRVIIRGAIANMMEEYIAEQRTAIAKATGGSDEDDRRDDVDPRGGERR